MVFILGTLKNLVVTTRASAISSHNIQATAKSLSKIRPAERADVVFIHHCNNRYLPEKYTLDFLFKHFEGYPSLAYIAEDEDANLIGYALGRVKLANGVVISNLKAPAPTFLGHISSVCVAPEFRGQGIARDLMCNIHRQFIELHAVRTVTLHVRCSNQAAINLYSKNFGYRCAERLKGYYDDGEDAWLMINDDLSQATKRIGRGFSPSTKTSLTNSA
jgi:peptide alpha-N-acetyltransferase